MSDMALQREWHDSIMTVALMHHEWCDCTTKVAWLYGSGMDNGVIVWWQ